MYYKNYSYSKYLGLSINGNHEFNEEYLRSAHQVLINALNEHARTFMFHVVLRYPVNHLAEVEGNISRFINAFKAKVRADRERKLREKKNVHATSVRYVWCREYSELMTEHFHVFFLINNDTYHKLGSFCEPSEGHLTWMISTAWASSINLPQINLGGLVEFAGWKKINAKKIPSSHTKERDGVVRDSFESAFHWMSYLCKINTKFYGNNVRNFGCSRD
ncbi:inovirus Gp2 family protein [Vibrio natriegens]|uniref:inovirus Gp2 family protein n=1 Tax=Vibrio natriegens TaxID=691 RepID=UPI0015938BE2|nr:inovirus Gp2 family protein [Vibrio natriegens]NVC93098.1 inovirus Gp2 family protein [Vibrio natriegens]